MASNSTVPTTIPGPGLNQQRFSVQDANRSNRGGKQNMAAGGHNTSDKGPGKLRGHPRDPPAVRLSKTLSWLLRHGAVSEGLKLRPDGYINVPDLFVHQKLVGLDLAGLQEIVAADSKQRYSLIREPPATGGDGGDDVSAWWIRANQGHTLKSVQVELQPILSASDVPMAVHGTTLKAWQIISKEGLSKMKRNHIHLAQHTGRDVISGMRASSQVLIYVDLEKALAAGIKFFLSANGVVLTEGDERGILDTKFFKRVEDSKQTAMPGWGAPRF